MRSSRIPILYLAPWVDFGGSDKGTIDWFKWIDRSVFAPSLITTQPSANRRLAEIQPFAEEVWALSDLFPGREYGRFIAQFIVSREIELVHVMNSRIGFDLLSDLRALPRPPAITVQLHVEEHTRDGYVRYVTTRFGNLVNAFSVTSEHLAEAVYGYGISRDRITVIPTGVDAESEFNPELIAPRSGLEPGVVHVLYPGRLVEQKDPLLMVDVARELAGRGLRFRIHVVGSGDLEPVVRERTRENSLESMISFEPPTHDLAPWYAAADLLLMTSVFEGVPYVVYEAMAMAVPVVAPALVGNVELMGDVGGTLVAERARPEAYADGLEPLIADRQLRLSTGRAGRNRVMERFSLREMADRHGALYRELLGRRAAQGAGEPPAADGDANGLAESEPDPIPEPVSFAGRPSRGTPLVTILTPCFNHGRVLRECVESVRVQTYPEIEMIVVDDGSTESETLEYLLELERGREVRVLRMPRNSGPSAARNRGLDQAKGRYILPLDSDNLLLPGAIEQLVSQLQSAGEQIGYVYPSIQYFGNREDLFEPPSFNLWLLTTGNYIDTCALIDRDVFDLGIRYSEEILLGHEDWDFFLTLADRGIYGEPAPATKLMYRKRGFTRSDLVDTSLSLFEEQMAERHKDLFGAKRTVRARWAPSLSLIALASVRRDSLAWSWVAEGLYRQRFGDFELLTVIDKEPELDGLVPRVRTLAGCPADRRGELLAHALELTAAPHVVATYGTGAELLREAGSIERIVRVLELGSASGVLAFADAPGDRRFAWSSIPSAEPELEPHTLAWSRRHRILRRLPAGLDRDDPLGDLARWRQLQRVSIQWRHLPLITPRSHRSAGSRVPLATVPRSPGETSERHSRLEAKTHLPGGAVMVPRWAGLPTWMPPAMNRLARHRRIGSDEWRVTDNEHPPPGFDLEHRLGLVHWMSFDGCKRLVWERSGGYRVIEQGTEPDAIEMEQTLGYVEQVAFPLLEPLMLCRHAASGRTVLVCGEDDPLRPDVEWPQLATLGFIERWPVNPHRAAVPGETTGWLRGLVRTIDPVARRHRVAIGTVGTGDSPWELGALLDRDPGGGIPAWIDDDDRLHTDGYVPSRYPFSPRRMLRWVGAPAVWSDVATPLQRAKAITRRGVQAARAALSDRASSASPALPSPAGWLLAEPGPHRFPILSAIHPATHDQLVTRTASEVRDLGYESPRMVGYALAVAPITGSLGWPTPAVPWAERFGRKVSHAEDPLAVI
ncbi:MAG TPA: glycosyltransferase [Solirubrobacteraceae bacterium]